MRPLDDMMHPLEDVSLKRCIDSCVPTLERIQSLWMIITTAYRRNVVALRATQGNQSFAHLTRHIDLTKHTRSCPLQRPYCQPPPQEGKNGTGTHRPRDASSKGRHCPKGRIVHKISFGDELALHRRGIIL